MSKKRILFISQEMGPYTALGEISATLKKLPKYVQEKGFEVRVLMPKYGTINERRHKLHEVVRLSGMNIVVDDDDYPLIIKVASFPGARMQVYFLDNEEFFSRKQIFNDAKGKPFKDNTDRMVFFCKGVIETVKKFGWAPDIISCHGWFTSLIPYYLQSVYQNEPIFEKSKLLYTAYADQPPAEVDKKFLDVAAINNLDAEALSDFVDGDKINLQLGAVLNSAGIIEGSEELDSSLTEAAKDKTLLGFTGEEELLEKHLTLFREILTEE